MSDLITKKQGQSAQPVLRDSLPVELERLLNSKSIDWTGHLLGISTIVSVPVPVVAKGSKDYFLLLTAANQIQRALKPATPREILYSLARLRLHYANNTMGEDELAILLEDYMSDLSLYPLDILDQACLEYRRDGNSLFFPKVGQLILLADKYLRPRKLKLERIKKLLEVSN